MLDENLFDEIIDRAGIDLTIVDDPDLIMTVVEEVYDEVELKYTANSGPLIEKDKRLLIGEVAERLVVKLYKMFHERSDGRE